jgi:histidinol-phosphate/aromatic aminotransferase/cobyric acid decarboxylase-like protein
MWHEHPKEAREQALQHLKPTNEQKVHPPEQEVLVRAIQQELEVIEQLYEDELDRLRNEYAERLATQEAQLREEIALLGVQIAQKDQQISELNERIKEAHILLSQEQHKTPEPSKRKQKKHWWEFWKRG